ncbi:hypothetical protein DPMN_006763 [Dreissena polymorpha]|uniref:Uncharacterized protein n=1 Tax=Dreissena polymorpha TaxID=45954 RepID=A0A9D4MUV0_DREPO|nr:hypothetical protein DPMN_006763 [Dreissena polymorpha]
MGCECNRKPIHCSLYTHPIRWWPGPLNPSALLSNLLCFVILILAFGTFYWDLPLATRAGPWKFKGADLSSPSTFAT